MVINDPSGSGKTTFLNLIACIDRPTNGEMFLEKQQTISLSEGQLANLRKEKIGLIFQTFNLIPMLSAFWERGVPVDVAADPGRRREIFSFGVSDHERRLIADESECLGAVWLD